MAETVLDPSVQDDETSWIDPSTGADLRPKIEEKVKTRPVEEVPTTPYVAPTHGEPTPIETQLGGPAGAPPPTTKYQGPDPNQFPSWGDVTQTDTFKNADQATRMTMLQNYTEQAKEVGHYMAAQNQEKPEDYDKHADEFYKRERGNIRGPYGVIDDAVTTTEGTLSTAAKAAAHETTKMAVGFAEGAKNILYPELDNSDIGKLSVDQAKVQREQIANKQEALDERAEKAKEYLKNPLAWIQNPDKRFDGGSSGAIDAIQISNANKSRMAALDQYISTNGTKVPKQTQTEAVSEQVEKLPEKLNNAWQVDQNYVKEHPQLAKLADTVGRIAPFLVGGTIATAAGGGPLSGAAIATDAWMNLSDAYQNGMESAEAKIEQREKNGEYFTPFEREKLKRDTASLDAFGVGSFQTASNLVLGAVTHGVLHVGPGAVSSATFGERLEQALMHPEQVALKAGLHEIPMQVGLQMGAQYAGNLALKASGASPDQDLGEGMDEAMSSGFTLAGLGIGMRGVGTAFKYGVEQAKINGFVNKVREHNDNLQEAFPDLNLTNNQMNEVALAQIPPRYQDAVRAKLILQESAKDQRDVADNLRKSGSPETAQETEKNADTTENTSVVDLKSQLAKEMAERKAAKEAAKAAKEQAKTVTTKEAVTPTTTTETPTTTTTTPTTTTETPTEEETPTPTPVVSDQELNDKLTQVLGDNPTAEDKRKLGQSYLNVVHGVDSPFAGKEGQIHRWSVGQTMHDLGLMPLETPGKNWAKNTPQTLGDVRNHFADFLDDRIEDNKQKAADELAAKAKAAAAPQEGATSTTEGGIPAEAPKLTEAEKFANAMPPSVFNDAVKTDNPWELIRQLKEGKQHYITEDESVKYDDFLYKHGIDITPETGGGTGYFLNADKVKIPTGIAEAVTETDPRIKKILEAKEEEAAPEKELTPEEQALQEKLAAQEEKEDRELGLRQEKGEAPIGTAETDVVKLKGNSQKLAEATDALPEHPAEQQYLEDAIKQLRDKENLTGMDIGDSSQVQNVHSAALARFRYYLRKNPERIPSIEMHRRAAIKDFGEKVTAAKQLKRKQQVALDRPLPEGGEAVATQAEAAEAESKAKQPQAETPEDEVERQKQAQALHPNTGVVGQEDLQKLAERIVSKLTDPAEIRSAWYQLREGLGVEIPEGVASAAGIKPEVHRNVAAKIAHIIRESPDDARGREETPAPGGGPGTPTTGAAGDQHPPGEPTVHAAVPEGTVSPQQPAGGELRPTTERAGGTTPGVPEARGTPAGETGGVLPGTAAGTAAVTKPPAGTTGGKRTKPLTRDEHAARVAGESTGVVKSEVTKGTAPTGGGKPGAGKPVAKPEAPPAPKEHAALAVAKAMMKKPEIAEEHDIHVEDFEDAEELAEHLEEQEGDHGQTGAEIEGWYREMAEDLGIKLPKTEPERPATPAAQALKQEKAAETPKPTTTGLENIGQAGAAISENMRNMLWDKFQKGVTTEAGGPSNLLLLAAREKNEGRITSRPEFEDFVTRYGESLKANQPIKDFAESEATRKTEPAKTAPKPTPGQEKIVARGSTPAEKINSLTEQVAKAAMRDPELAADYGIDVDEIFGGESFDPNKRQDVQHLTDAIDGSFELADHPQHMAKLERIADAFNAKVPETVTKESLAAETKAAPKVEPSINAPAPKTEAHIPRVIATLADKLALHFNANPEIAEKLAMPKGATGQDVVKTIKQFVPNMTPDKLMVTLQRMAQKEGLLDPPKPPGGTESPGVMHNLKPGMATPLPGMRTFTGRMGEFIMHFRKSNDPAMREFAKSLNAHFDTVKNMVVRQINTDAPVVFYHNGELFISPAMLENRMGPHAIAHEIQHAIAWEKTGRPSTVQDLNAAGRWHELHDELFRHLPEDLQDDLLMTNLPDVLDRFNGMENIDTRFLTARQKDWLPILYAAYKPEHMLEAAFSNRIFRDYLGTLREGGGDSLLSKVYDWSRGIFGEHAMEFADAAYPHVADRPGIPASFDPRKGSLKDVYPLTAAEERTQAVARKYQLNQGIEAALRQVGNLSDKPAFRILAKALQVVAAKNPEIVVNLENRLGGYAGTYEMFGDRVVINPHSTDNDIEHTIMHEFVHAMTVGKIKSYELGQIHLLTAEEMQSMGRLEDLRMQALHHPDVPEIIRTITLLPTYEQREQALLKLFAKKPSYQKWYGLTDPGEFASETLTNGEFQAHLQKISSTEEGGRPRNVLQRVFDWVKRFIGIPDDSLHSKAMDEVVKLMGGRRVMEADVTVGHLEGTRGLMQKENLLIKRYLDHRAEAEGWKSTREVPIDALNDWAKEYREGQGISTRPDPYSVRSIGSVDTTSHAAIDPLQALAAHPNESPQRQMSAAWDQVDHLAKVNGMSTDDTDGMRGLVDRAYRDRALDEHQYALAHQAIGNFEDFTYRRLPINLGDKDDPHSVVGWLDRAFKKTVSPSGLLPKGLHDELLTHDKYAKAEIAARIVRSMTALNKAIAQSYKGGRMTDAIKDDMNKILHGGSAPHLPSKVIEALNSMRADIDYMSAHIIRGDMKGEAKLDQIYQNIGSYVHRSYRMFEDPRWAKRKMSAQHRTQAELEMNNLLGKKKKNQVILLEARNAGAEAARAYTHGTVEYQNAYDKAYDAAKIKAAANPASSWIDRQISDWEQRAHNQQTGNLQYGHAFSINDKIMNELSPYLSKSEGLRKLIGEETDVKAQFARTMWRQSAFINSVEMSRAAAKLGRESGWLSEEWNRKNTAQIPKEFVHMGEMAGKWTTPDIADTLTNYSETLRSIDNGPLMHTLRFLEGRARYATTIGSIQRGVANLWGGIFAHLNNGYFNPLDMRANSNAWNVLRAQVFRQSGPELNAFMDEMHRYGLSDKNGQIGMVMNYLAHGPHIMERDALDSAEGFSQWFQKIKNNRALNKFGEVAIDFHTVGNFMSKASQWIREQDRQREINDWDVKNAGAQQMSKDQIKAAAADIVRHQNISYSLATKTIQQMRKNPFLGTFLTFAGESLRSYIASGTYALQYLKSSNPVKRRIGVQRLGGMIASMLVPAGLQMASQAVYGVGGQEDENFRHMLPPWEKNNWFMYGPEINGRRTYTNMNYVMPQGDIGRAIHALFAPNQDGILGKVWESGYELTAPFWNTALIPSALIDIKRNQTEYGTPVYMPQDHWWNQLNDMSQHVLQRQFGGTAGRLFTKMIPAVMHSGEGKVSPGGAVYDWTSAVLPEFLGMNIKEISYADRFRSQMFSTKDSIAQAQRTFTGPIQRSGNELTDDQMTSLYQRSEYQRRRVFQDLEQKIEAVRFGGMSNREIRSALKERQFSTQTIDDLMTGRYHPYTPGKDILKNARANGNFIPPSMFRHRAEAIDEEEEE